MGDFKKYWVQITILVGLFVTLIMIEYLAPKPQDWTPSFAKDDKIPYGNYILFRMLPDIFPDQEIEVNDYSFYESSDGLLDGYSNLILISRSFQRMDSLDYSLILTHVEQGGNVFMAGEHFGYHLEDTLKLDTYAKFLFFHDSIAERVNFENPSLADDSGYVFPKNYTQSYFSSVDSSRTIALGRTSDNSLNFISVPFGKGTFYLHNQPVLFTNYNILYENNSEYVERALSYLPKRRTIWDEYHHHYSKKKQTPLRYIFSQPALYWAWLTLIVGTLLYVLFEGKRVQRIIPIVVPPRNHSLEFITTIGRLYFHRRDNKNLAEKKFSYLAEYLRTKFYLSLQETNLEDAKEVAQRLDIKTVVIEKLFAHYNIIKSKTQISNDELIAFHQLIEEFYQELNQ